MRDLLRTLRYILHLEAFQDKKPVCLPCRRCDLEYSNRQLSYGLLDHAQLTNLPYTSTHSCEDAGSHAH